MNALTLNTKQKIALARSVNWGVRLLRKSVGRSMEGVFSRNGLEFDLNLDEGIEFAIFLLGSFEPEVVKQYDSILKPGNVVLDVGANIGAHTLHFAKRVAPDGRVYAFEPTDYAFGKLQRNLELNPQLKETVVASQLFLGVTDEDEVPAELYSSWPLLNSGEELHGTHLGALKTTSGAKSTSLDAFCEKHGIAAVDFLKVDVDGHEIPVLQGATRVLNEMRPIILMELAPDGFAELGYDFGDLVTMIDLAGYRMTDAATSESVPVVESEIRRRIPAGAGMNVILNPVDRV
jgi:FkbM family methyltransferase